MHRDRSSGRKDPGTVCILKLQIDESICSMYDYFEIFLGRMMFCRKSAEILGTTVKRTFAIRFATCS
ncbi:MAG: hypothetical protein EGR15_04810 [Lachnospiraceae bacterium]|nr:hypothetical protein [Lachnospiraceae bacterium]